MKKKKKSSKKQSSESISLKLGFLIHSICSLSIAVGFYVAHSLYSINLVTHPSSTLRLISVIQCPIVILVYSVFRSNPEKCSYFKAVGRGILGIPIGALVHALGAIVLGAPVGIQYLSKTMHWSLLMSSLTFLPVACVYGASWIDWQRLFAHTKPNGSLEYMMCLPAHGAVIGAWFGAFPMPLDWERPWQEWPICVSYGAIAGYLIGMVASLCFQLVRRASHVKGE
ncbi:hypothetical protein ACFE04_012467 [Oxalis oulophora]